MVISQERCKGKTKNQKGKLKKDPNFAKEYAHCQFHTLLETFGPGIFQVMIFLSHECSTCKE